MHIHKENKARVLCPFVFLQVLHDFYLFKYFLKLKKLFFCENDINLHLLVFFYLELIMKKEFKTLAIFTSIFGMTIVGQASKIELCNAPYRATQHSSPTDPNFQLNPLHEKINRDSANKWNEKTASFWAPIPINTKSDPNLIQVIQQNVQNGELNFNPNLFS